MLDETASGVIQSRSSIRSSTAANGWGVIENPGEWFTFDTGMVVLDDRMTKTQKY